MWRRLGFFVFSVSLVSCLLIGSALAAESNNTYDLPDGEYTVEDVPAYITFGFDTHEEFETFLYYLNAYEPEFDGEFADYLALQYPDYDAELAYILYKDVEGLAIEPLAEGSSVTFDIVASSGATVGTARWYYKDTVYGVSFYRYLYIKNIPVTATTSNSAWPGTLPSTLTLDVAALSAGGCNWTSADIKNTVEYLRLISTYLNTNTTISYFWRDDTGRWAPLYNVSGEFSTANLLSKLLNTVVGINQTYFTSPSGTEYLEYWGGQLHSATADGSGIMELMRRAMGSLSQGFYDTYNLGVSNHSSLISTLKDYLVSSVAGTGLAADGSLSSLSSGLDIANLLARTNTTITGFNNNTIQALKGSYSGYSAIGYEFDPETLERRETIFSAGNILEAIVYLGCELQRPLSQIQAVLANDDELELRQRTQEQVDAVTDNFTGDGGSAPTTADIGDMADISKDFSGMFDSGVTPGEFIGSVNGADSYSFFSQATSDALDSTSAPAALSDDDDDFFDLSGYVENELGVLVPAINPW